MLLAAFDARRATVDADLLAMGAPNDADAVLARVRDIAGHQLAQDDGVRFLPDTARARIIRADSLYSGVRATMAAHIAKATVTLQLDINFGDPVTPPPQIIDYPTLREEHPPVRVLGYPLATLIAEKLTTAVDLGETSTRVRDYTDIWVLTRRHDLDADELRTALAATALHRGVRLGPLSDAVGDLASLRRDVYTAYRNRVNDVATQLPEHLDQVLADVISFADPLLRDAPRKPATWSAGQRRWLS